LSRPRLPQDGVAAASLSWAATARSLRLTAIRCCQGDLNTGNSHSTFADGRSTTFDRAGPDIACGKNSRKTGFERTGLAFVLFPSRRIRHGRSCLDESFVVAFDLEWQPLGAWVGSDHGKDRGCSDNAPLARLCIFQLGFFEHFVPRHFSNLGAIKNLDVPLHFHPS